MNTTGKKYGGRKKGTPNKLTKELREVLKNVLYNEIENIEESLKSLEPKQRIELLVKLMPFIFPKITSVHFREDEPYTWG